MCADSIKPIPRVPTSSLIADQLRQAIMDGTLEPGAQLGETELAGRFGVSRGPLREAMQRLVQEGLLVSERHRGLFVITLTPDDIRDIYAARMAVEGAAATLILQGDPEHTASKLADTHATMVSAAERGDLEALAAADLAFHELLVEESASPRLQRMARTLLVETRMCMTALQDHYSAPRDLADEHLALIEALRARDRARVLELVDLHMQDAVARLAPTDGSDEASAADSA